MDIGLYVKVGVDRKYISHNDSATKTLWTYHDTVPGVVSGLMERKKKWMDSCSWTRRVFTLSR